MPAKLVRTSMRGILIVLCNPHTTTSLGLLLTTCEVIDARGRQQTMRMDRTRGQRRVKTEDREEGRGQGGKCPDAQMAGVDAGL